MADIIKRLNYFHGQFLREADFTAEQDYHLDRQRRHNRLFHTPGIAHGLTVTVNTNSVTVAPGTAIDAKGQQIVLHEPSVVGFHSSLYGQTALVVISYADKETDESTEGDTGNTRILEEPVVDAILDDGSLDEDLIPLARLEIDDNGAVVDQDMNVRVPAGARLRPEETLERLRLSRPGVLDPSLWPVLSSGAANRADVTGSLNVTGSILVGGTVDGRDVAADGVKLDTLALSKIEGVSNPGGDIDLIGQNGINITGSSSAKTITFAGGSPISIDGVANPGGNVDLVAGGAIAISPDNTAKRITISETHSGVTGNPHGTLASQLADYDFKSVFTDDLWFYEIYGDGATQTIEPGFQARLIVVTGYAQGRFFGQWHGSPVHGIARIVGSSIVQNGCGPLVKRDSGVPYIFQTGIEATGIVAACSFTNNVSPTFSYWANVRVSSVTSTAVTFMLNSWGTSSANWFDMQLRFTCFG